MLMSLHKHLNVKSIQYLSRLIANLDMNQHNEQTLLLSALLTKNLWFLMLDIGNSSKKECNNKSSKLNKDLNNISSKKKYEKQKVKIKLLNYSNKKNEKKNLMNNKKKKQQQNINFANADEFDEQNLDATSNASSTKNSIKSNCSGGVVDDNGSRNESDEEILNAKIINGTKMMPQKSK